MKAFYPVIAVPSIPLPNGKIRFFCKNKIKDVKVNNSLVLQILQFCDGYHTEQQIASLTNCNIQDICLVIKQFINAGLIIDRNEQYLRFHEISEYPSSFPISLNTDEVYNFTKNYKKEYKHGRNVSNEMHTRDDNSYFVNIVQSRYTCRDFSDKLMSSSTILSILKIAYSLKIHAVPSAGGLYPMRIYVVVNSNQEDLSKGYYEYNSEEEYLICFDDNPDIETIKFIFNSESLPFNSKVQIIIASELRRQPYKYGNRGYRFTLFEAGAIAENIALYCAENGIGMCELGGVLDEPFREEFCLCDTDIYPLIGIAIGYEKENANNEYRSRYNIEKLVGDDKFVTACGTRTYNNGTLFFSWAKSKNGLCGATGTSEKESEFKAVMEGYERAISGNVRHNFFCSAKDLTAMNYNWIDPRLYVPLSNKQVSENGFDYFDKELPIKWIKGYTIKNGVKQTICVPVDLVFYGFTHEANEHCIYITNSSGVSAHFDYSEAEKRALTELLERDAIMKMWYKKETQKLIEPDCLPIHAIKRTDFWRTKNRILEIYTVNSEYAHVFLAIIRSKEWPCFACGSSATLDHQVDKAINKAITEAEYSMFATIQNGKKTPPSIEEVVRPSDHAAFYHYEENMQYLSWIWNEPVFIDKNSIPASGYLADKYLYEKLKIIFIEMSIPSSTIKVIRALSHKLVPISFGLKRAHYLHPYLTNIKESDRLPHFFD